MSISNQKQTLAIILIGLFLYLAICYRCLNCANEGKIETQEKKGKTEATNVIKNFQKVEKREYSNGCPSTLEITKLIYVDPFSVTVEGIFDPTIKLKINGKEIFINEKGEFSHNLRLSNKSKKRELIFEAIDAKGNKGFLVTKLD